MIPIPRDKLLGAGEQLQNIAQSNGTNETNWASLVKEVIENIPQGVTMVKKIIEDVKEVKNSQQNYTPTPPTYDEEPTQKPKEIIIPINNTARAEEIFNNLIKQAENFKGVLSMMNGNKILQMAKEDYRETIINKIEKELSK